jgi:hypothetical protein
MNRLKVLILLGMILLLIFPGIAEAKGGKVKAVAHGKHKDADPCGDNCGNGDRGNGNPGNPGQGSDHASCRAAQGEVDPVCEQPDIPETPPTVMPSRSPDGQRQQLRGVAASVLEIFSNEHPLQEEYVLAEVGTTWEYLDFHAPAGESYVFLWWSEERGHSGPTVYICVESVSDQFVMVSPFLREVVKVNGVYMAPGFRTGDLAGLSDQEICALLTHLHEGGSVPKQPGG